MDKIFSDEELMIEIQNGNKAAFDKLYKRHIKGLYRYLLRKCNNESDAEDLFQEVWEKLYKYRNKFKANASFKTYLYTIANNHFIDYYRKKKRREGINQVNPGNTEEDLAAGENCQPEHQAEVEEQRQMMLQLVDKLPQEQREVILLREEGLSLDEIADVLGLNKELAKSRLRYAHDKLRAWMGLNE